MTASLGYKGVYLMKRRYVMLLSFAFSLVIVIMAVFSYTMIDALLQENSKLKAQLVAAQAAAEHGSLNYVAGQTILVEVEKSYCNLMIDQWDATDEELTIHTAYAQAVMVSNAALATAEHSRLVLRMGDQEVSTYDVTLNPGESSESLEADLEDITFQIPTLGTRDELELWLEVTLPGNITVTGYGASWYQEGGMLHLISG